MKLRGFIRVKNMMCVANINAELSPDGWGSAHKPVSETEELICTAYKMQNGNFRHEWEVIALGTYYTVPVTRSEARLILAKTTTGLEANA